MNYFEKIVSEVTGLTDRSKINEILNIVSMGIDLGGVTMNVLKREIKNVCNELK